MDVRVEGVIDVRVKGVMDVRVEGVMDVREEGYWMCHLNLWGFTATSMTWSCMMWVWSSCTRRTHIFFIT